MNQIATQNTAQLPAHLAHLAQHNVAMSAMGGITTGTAINQIGIKAGRWRLQNTQGDEQVVPHIHLDVIIADANPNLSKVFYLGAYNPADTEAKAPDCYSDNGVAPSTRAAKPQCSSCAACPHNVWGSKVTPSGGQTKACSDSKKLAVILADNPTGPVYLLKVPAASLKNLYTIVEQLANRGIPLPAMIMRLTFDPAADYPKIVFSPLSWSNEAQAQALNKILGADEIKVVIGTNDLPRTEALAAVTTSVVVPQPAGPAPFLNQLQTAPLMPATPQTAADPFAGAGACSNPAAAPAKRKRRSKAEMEADTAAKSSMASSQSASQTIPAVDPFAGFAAATSLPAANPFAGFTTANTLQDIPQHMAAASAVHVNPTPTDSALDDLINSALKV